MLKSLAMYRLFIKYFSHFFLVICLMLFFSCTTGPQLPEPNRVSIPKRELTKEEILSISSYSRLKAVVNLDMEAAGKLLLDSVTAVFYMEDTGRARLRIYKFGMPVFDIVNRDGEVRSRPPEEAEKYSDSFSLLMRAVFWWRSMNEARLEVLKSEYLLQTPHQAVWLKRMNLLPVKQEIFSKKGIIKIRYSNPEALENRKDFPSKIEINSLNYRLVVTVKRVATDVAFDNDMFEWP